ncbi:hypothetical protein PENSPDRAFT_72180 [Peniophora sp. CONT]|nr:hypothetical protein PENSPDRAFT_72180 [Peniophora sp. CONT]
MPASTNQTRLSADRMKTLSIFGTPLFSRNIFNSCPEKPDASSGPEVKSGFKVATRPNSTSRPAQKNTFLFSTTTNTQCTIDIQMALSDRISALLPHSCSSASCLWIPTISTSGILQGIDRTVKSCQTSASPFPASSPVRISGRISGPNGAMPERLCRM